MMYTQFPKDVTEVTEPKN